MDLNFGMIGAGAVLGLGAIGSSIGLAFSCSAAIAAWKRNFLRNQPASSLLFVFAGAPMTQTIYSFILMTRMMASTKDPFFLLAAGLGAGLAIGLSAVAQGMASAASCDAFGELGKGFAQFITVVGMTESIALFTLAFTFSLV